jgi:hypothetical protein
VLTEELAADVLESDEELEEEVVVELESEVVVVVSELSTASVLLMATVAYAYIPPVRPTDESIYCTVHNAAVPPYGYL